MIMKWLAIDRKSEDEFEFSYYKSAPAENVDEERGDIVRFMDEAVDALMRQSQMIENFPLGFCDKVCRVKIQTTGRYEKD